MPESRKRKKSRRKKTKSRRRTRRNGSKKGMTTVQKVLAGTAAAGALTGGAFLAHKMRRKSENDFEKLERLKKEYENLHKSWLSAQDEEQRQRFDELLELKGIEIDQLHEIVQTFKTNLEKEGYTFAVERPPLKTKKITPQNVTSIFPLDMSEWQQKATAAYYGGKYASTSDSEKNKLTNMANAAFRGMI